MIRGHWRLRGDVPEFTRCCFCLSLRHGLLVWGYLKMIGLLLFAFLVIEEILRIIAFSSYDVTTIMIIFLFLVAIDIIFNMMFIVAGHMKHHHVFQIYYYYSLVFLGVFVIGYIIVLGSYFYSFNHTPGYKFLLDILDTLYIAVPIVMVQMYVSLLVRTEVQNLGKNSNFQTLNPAVDASSPLCLNNVENGSEPQ